MMTPTNETAAPNLDAGLAVALCWRARQNGRVTAVRTPKRQRTYEDLAAQHYRDLDRAERLAKQRVGLTLEALDAWVPMVAALTRLGAHVFLLSPSMAQDRVKELAAEFCISAIVETDGSIRDLPATAGAPAATPALTLFTSGSTGAPKAVTHAWARLMRPVRKRPELEHSRWLLTYPTRLYAGLQVLTQAIVSGGTLTVADNRSAGAVCRQIRDHGIQYVPATPSFWRWLLAFGDLDALRGSCVEQISLGGEPVSDQLLTALRSAFPAARIIHIYATSELGRCFSVTDGQAGFPESYLTRCPEPGVSLRIVDGELQARSENSMLGYTASPVAAAPDWLATGDLVEASGGRIRFRGRKTEIINVGGNKVSPLEVETLLRQTPGVADVCVYPVESSLAGQMVAADFVLVPGTSEGQSRENIARQCVEQLQNYQRPRILRFVDHLAVLEAGKLNRKSHQRAAE